MCQILEKKKKNRGSYLNDTLIFTLLTLHGEKKWSLSLFLEQFIMKVISRLMEKS